MACGDTSHPYETISWLLGSADGPRGRADTARVLVCSSLSPGALRQPISHACSSMSVTMASGAFFRFEASGVKTLAKCLCSRRGRRVAALTRAARVHACS